MLAGTSHLNATPVLLTMRGVGPTGLPRGLVEPDDLDPLRLQACSLLPSPMNNDGRSLRLGGGVVVPNAHAPDERAGPGRVHRSAQVSMTRHPAWVSRAVTSRVPVPWGTSRPPSGVTRAGDPAPCRR